MNNKHFIAIVSDMHLEPLDTANEQRASIRTPAEVRAKRAEAVRAELEAGPTPAATLFGGDNSNQPVSQSEYRRYAHSLMRRFPKPLRAVPGNHDVGSTVGWPHHDPKGMAEACAAFRQDWDDWWVLETAGFRILGVNTQILGSSLPKAEVQSEWLRARLAEPTEYLRVVFGHTPPYLKRPDDHFTDRSEQMCLQPEAREPLLDILNESPPDLLITAHAHRFWICNQPRWDWLGLPATAIGQRDMPTVPKHNLPSGDDSVGWISLRRNGHTWAAEVHSL